MYQQSKLYYCICMHAVLFKFVPLQTKYCVATTTTMSEVNLTQKQKVSRLFVDKRVQLSVHTFCLREVSVSNFQSY